MDRAKYSRTIEGAHDLDTSFFVSLAYDLVVLASDHDLHVSMSVEVRQREGEHGSRIRKSSDLTPITDGRVRRPDAVDLMLHGDAAGGPGPDHYVMSIIAKADGDHFVYADAEADMARAAFDVMVAAFEARRRMALPTPDGDKSPAAPWKGSYNLATGIQATVAAMTVLAFTRSLVLCLCTLAVVVCARGLWATTRRATDRPARMRARSVIDLRAEERSVDAPLLDHRPMAPLDLDRRP